MKFQREKIKGLLITARRVAARTVIALIVLVIAMLIFFQSSMFQAASKEAMKENVPRGWFHVYACLWTRCNPFKVIDPDDPRFKPEHFRFEDYLTESQLAYAISKIITRGMDRDTVERILVASGGATIEASKDGRGVSYDYPNKADLITQGLLGVRVFYPDAIHVERVWVHGNEVTLKNEGGQP